MVFKFNGAPAKDKLLAPVEIEEAPKPERDREPDVAVIVKAPVVIVKLLEAVKVCDEVKAPALVVVTPVLPSETEVAFVVPKFRPVPASIVKAAPEVNCEAPVGVKLTEPAPETLKLPEVKVKAIFVGPAVVMVAPPL
jgi:hypothetical protein